MFNKTGDSQLLKVMAVEDGKVADITTLPTEVCPICKKPVTECDCAIQADANQKPGDTI